MFLKEYSRASIHSSYAVIIKSVINSGTVCADNMSRNKRVLGRGFNF